MWQSSLEEHLALIACVGLHAVRAAVLREVHEAFGACGSALCGAVQPGRATDAAAPTEAWELGHAEAAQGLLQRGHP